MDPGGIRLERLAKRFGARTAVEGLTFEVQPGEVFGLLGPNGAGKTTTVRMLSGLLRPSEGEGVVAGLSLASADGSTLRQRVGLLTEQPGLYDRLTARENLRFFLKLHGRDDARAWTRAEHYLGRFGLADRLQEPCGTFSKGMRQKLAIVRALLHEPSVLFLDEPTSGLDPDAAQVVRDAVAELAAEGRTLVLCSHNLYEVERLCQRVAVIRNRLLTVAPVRALRGEQVTWRVTLEGAAEVHLEGVRQVEGVRAARATGATLDVELVRVEDAPELVARLVGGGARVFTAERVERPLEEVYLELVRGGEG